MTSIEQIRARLHELLDGAEGFSASVQFDFGVRGVVHVDGKGDVIAISDERMPAACTIAMSPEIFVRILAGELDETAAFMQGNMKLEGQIGLATQISELIRARAQEKAQMS